MLGLTYEIASNDLGIRTVIGDNEHLGYPSEQIDPNLIEKQALGLCHVAFPGPVIMSTGEISEVPNVYAASAWTPPMQ